MTDRKIHCTEVNLLTCGWVSIRVARSQSRFREYTLQVTPIRLPKWVTTKGPPKTLSELTAIVQRFCKQVIMWKCLHHPNVLPLLGVIVSGGHIAMVSEWMTNGNINEFVGAHRDVNRFELVGFFILLLTAPVIDEITPKLKDSARGLIYIHGEGMIRGDLKGVRFKMQIWASPPPNTTFIQG